MEIVNNFDIPYYYENVRWYEHFDKLGDGQAIKIQRDDNAKLRKLAQSMKKSVKRLNRPYKVLTSITSNGNNSFILYAWKQNEQS